MRDLSECIGAVGARLGPGLIGVAIGVGGTPLTLTARRDSHAPDGVLTAILQHSDVTSEGGFTTVDSRTLSLNVTERFTHSGWKRFVRLMLQRNSDPAVEAVALAMW